MQDCQDEGFNWRGKSKSTLIARAFKTQGEKKLKQIGANVFQLYSALNDIFITGTRIIESLEEYLSWMRQNLERQPVHNNAHAIHFSFLLRYQSINLYRFVASLESLKYEIQLVSPDTYISLPPILRDKARRVNLLMDVLEDKKLLLSFEGWDTVNFSGQLGSDHYEKLKNYVESASPREALDHIKEAAIACASVF